MRGVGRRSLATIRREVRREEGRGRAGAAWDGTERFEVLLKRAKTDNGVDGVANGAGAGAGAAAFFGARSAAHACRLSREEAVPCP